MAPWDGRAGEGFRNERWLGRPMGAGDPFPSWQEQGSLAHGFLGFSPFSFQPPFLC